MRAPWKLLCCIGLPLCLATPSLPSAAGAPCPEPRTGTLRNGEVIPLWGTELPPGSNATTAALVETVLSDGGTPQDPQRTIAGIATPTLTAFVPHRPNGVAVIITCGGGYTNLVIDKEGTDIARWLNTLHVTAFVLKFRLPGEGWDAGQDVPLQDGQRAMRLVRAHAAEWGLDASRIGAFGFSSGGHTASMIGTFYTEPVYAARDAADAQSARPDFLLLAYGPHTCNSQQVAATDACSPGTLGYQKLPFSPAAKQALYDKYATDLKVDVNAPPAFIVMANDDNKVDPENAIRFYLALKRAGVSTTTRPPLPVIPAELHIFTAGAHGFAIRNAKGFPIAIWTTLAQNWMAYNGILPAELCRVCNQ